MNDSSPEPGFFAAVLLGLMTFFISLLAIGVGGWFVATAYWLPICTNHEDILTWSLIAALGAPFYFPPLAVPVLVGAVVGAIYARPFRIGSRYWRGLGLFLVGALVLALIVGVAVGFGDHHEFCSLVKM